MGGAVGVGWAGSLGGGVVGWSAVGGVSGVADAGGVVGVVGDAGDAGDDDPASEGAPACAAPRFAGASTGAIDVALPGELAVPLAAFDGPEPVLASSGTRTRGRSVCAPVVVSVPSTDEVGGATVGSGVEDACACPADGRDDGMNASVSPPPTSATVDATTARRRCFFQSASRRRRAARPVAEGVAGPAGVSTSGSGWKPGNASNSRVCVISDMTATVDGVWWTWGSVGSMSGA